MQGRRSAGDGARAPAAQPGIFVLAAAVGSHEKGRPRRLRWDPPPPPAQDLWHRARRHRDPRRRQRRQEGVEGEVLAVLGLGPLASPGGRRREGCEEPHKI